MAEKKIVFVVESIGSEETVRKLASANLAYKEIVKELKNASKAGDESLFQKLSIDAEKLKQSITKLKTEVKDQNRAFDAAKYPLDSLKSLENQYGRLTKSIRQMSAEQRNSFEGSNIVNKANELKEAINKQSQAFGDNTKNIGNYTKSIQQAFDNPIRFLKGAGLAGIIATIGVQLFKMGSAAVEAFGKTEEGAKKLKGVQLGFERLKAIGQSFLFGVIEKILPVLEKILPPITKAFNFVVASIASSLAFIQTYFGNVISNSKQLINNLKIGYLEVKKFFGDTSAQASIDNLKKANTELAASFKDPIQAAKEAFASQLLAGKQAAENAKLQTEKTKGLAKEQITALEELKKKEKELDKIIDDKAAKNKDYTKELGEQVKITLQILAIEKAIADAKEEALFAATLDLEVAKKRRAVEAAPLSKIQTNTINEVVSKSDSSIFNDKKRIDSAKSVAEAQKKINEDAAKAALKLFQDQEAEKNRIRQQTKEILINGLADLAILQLQKETDTINQIQDRRLQSLNSEFDKKKALATGNSELLSRLESDRLKQEEKINKEASKKRQNIAIKQALINAALASTQALANTLLPFPASLAALIPVGAALAIQIAAIKAQKFDKGGFTGKGFNHRDESGKRVAGIVHEKEYVAPENQVNKYPELFAALNSDRVANRPKYSIFDSNRLRQFAIGGFTKPSLPQSLRSGSISKSEQGQFSGFSEDQIRYLASAIGIAASNGTYKGLEMGLENADRIRERKRILNNKLSG